MAGVSAEIAGTIGESRYAEVNGIRLHYVTAGRGKLILFLHGFPEFWFAWKDALADFARDHQAVAPDLRGFNLSDKPDGVKAYRAVHLVEDLRQLIAHLGHPRCILVAHDWGGAVAWNFAAQYPQLVEKLVILNSPHPVLFARELAHDAQQQAASQYMLLLRSDKAERVMAEDDFARLRRQLDDWRAGPNPPDARTLALYHSAWTQPGALTAMCNYYRASPLYPPHRDVQVPRAQDAQERPPHRDVQVPSHRDSLRSRAQDASAHRDVATLNLNPADFTVRVPTLVIWGERDTALRPGLLDGLSDYVPDLRIERIAEGSHWVAHDFPARVHAAIREFVAR